MPRPQEREEDGTALVELVILRERIAALEQLLAVLEATTMDEGRRSEQLEREIKLKIQELARSNADLEQFAYLVSHDLQEPLRMVASFSQLLKKRHGEHIGAEASEFLGYVLGGTERMKQMIDGILTYSRVGTHGRSLAPVNAEEVLAEVTEILRLAIEESGALISHDPLPMILADRQQFVQLLMNLLGNALKFRGHNPPRVHVSARRSDDEWIFSVADNGRGIDPRHFERIFLLFQRLHTDHEIPGLGIGLAVAKRIVERHGGRIWVASEPGRGSTFTFTLPAEGGTEP
ncbi:MAG: hypothetical protein HY698_16825 [Deltaproteobacteria bacterium]|nr:hypothetical protein [Deltaproteobacteria bacterium]